MLLERWLPAYAPPKVTILPMTLFDASGHTEEHETVNIERPSKAKLNIKHTLTKWLLDSMTIGALLNTIAFLVLMGILKGQSRARIAKNVRTVSYASPLECSCCTTP